MMGLAILKQAPAPKLIFVAETLCTSLRVKGKTATAYYPRHIIRHGKCPPPPGKGGIRQAG